MGIADRPRILLRPGCSLSGSVKRWGKDPLVRLIVGGRSYGAADGTIADRQRRTWTCQAHQPQRRTHR